jgi:hypothetical protein
MHPDPELLVSRGVDEVAEKCRAELFEVRL